MADPARVGQRACIRARPYLSASTSRRHCDGLWPAHLANALRKFAVSAKPTRCTIAFGKMRAALTSRPPGGSHTPLPSYLARDVLVSFGASPGHLFLYLHEHLGQAVGCWGLQRRVRTIGLEFL